MTAKTVFCIVFILMYFSPRSYGNEKKGAFQNVIDSALYYYTLWQAREARDSIYHRRLKECLEFPRDSLYVRYARSGYEAVMDGIFFLNDYVGIDPSPEKTLREINRMFRAADSLGSDELRWEAEFNRGAFIIPVNDSLLEKKIRLLEEFYLKAAVRDDAYLQYRALADMWHYCYHSGSFARAFYYSGRMYRLLQLMDENNKLRRKGFFLVGAAHYTLGDYEKSLPCFWTALSDRPEYFGDETNLKARNFLANYYKNHGRPDSAIHYFLSILKSNDLVKARPDHNAVALTNIAQYAFRNGEYDQAIAMLEAVIPVVAEHREFDFVMGIYTHLGLCYLAKGQTEDAWDMIQKARSYIGYPRYEKRMEDLYALMSKYYGHRGDIRLAGTYLDSALLAARQKHARENLNHIRKGEQQLYEMDMRSKDKEIRRFRVCLYLISLVVFLVLSGLILVAGKARRIRRAYGELVRQAGEWDEYRKRGNGIAVGTVISDENKEIATKIRRHVFYEEGFRNPDLTLTLLTEITGINRSYLSRTINEMTGKNFNAWLNEIRIREAVCCLLKGGMKPTLAEVAFRIGFNDRTTFYRSFRKMTGISPTEFCKSVDCTTRNRFSDSKL